MDQEQKGRGPWDRKPVYAPAEQDDFVVQRGRMVDEQIMARGVHDLQVLTAMRAVPRHEFLDPLYWSEAYEDHPLPLGRGQTVSQPYIVGYILEQATLDATSRVLEIGTGSGYQTAILARIAGEVVSLEIDSDLAAEARTRLAHGGVRNVSVYVADGYGGFALRAPYDAIIGSAAAPQVPAGLIAQLKIGGRLVIPIGTDDQVLWRIVRDEVGWRSEELLRVRFVPMVAGRPGDEDYRS